MTIKRNLRMKISNRQKCAFASGIICFILGTIILLLSTLSNSQKLIRDNLKQKLPIRPDSETFKNWMNSSVPIYMKFVLYNVTNQDDIIDGKKPILQEIGPYSYLEKRVKVSYQFENNGTQLVYTEKKYFIFDPETSVGNPYTDNVITINPLIATLFANIRTNPTIERLIDMVDFESLFIHKTINETLWGYKDEVIEEICSMSGLMCNKVLMGFMLGNNNTVGSEVNIDTGTSDLYRIGLINSYKGTSSLSIWNSQYANMINGSDGTMFKPLLPKNELTYVFASDVCRSFKFEYSKTISATNDGRISLFQFIGTRDQALNATLNPDNEGFCPPKPIGPRCPPGGLMDLSPCRSSPTMLVPLVASQPRFYLAEPHIAQSYDGIPVASESDQTVLNIEPTLGVPLEAHKRLQMNFYLRPDSKLNKYFGRMEEKDWYFPLFWLEESARADSVTLNKLYNKALFKIYMLDMFKLLAIVFGGVLQCSGIVIIILTCRKIKNMRSGKISASELPSTENTDNQSLLKAKNEDSNASNTPRV